MGTLGKLIFSTLGLRTGGCDHGSTQQAAAELIDLHGKVERDVTIAIKTFERPGCVDRLIASIRSSYPTVRILVADDSRSHHREDGSEEDGVKWLNMPFDSGVSAGRNLILDQVETPFIMVLDDDFIFTGKTRLEYLYQSIAEHDLDLVAGKVDGKSYHALFENDEGQVRIHKNRTLKQEGNLIFSHRVMSFFLAKTDRLRDFGGWDPELKTYDHTAFFLRAFRSDLKIAEDTRVDVDHDHQCVTEEQKAFYQKHRYRRGDNNIEDYLGHIRSKYRITGEFP